MGRGAEGAGEAGVRPGPVLAATAVTTRLLPQQAAGDRGAERMNVCRAGGRQDYQTDVLILSLAAALARDEVPELRAQPQTRFPISAKGIRWATGGGAPHAQTPQISVYVDMTACPLRTPNLRSQLPRTRSRDNLSYWKPPKMS